MKSLIFLACFVASSADSAQALQCKSLLAAQIVSPASFQNKVQRQAETYAKKRQKKGHFAALRMTFYRSVTQLLLWRNLGRGRVSVETTKEVYNETVTKIKGLLAETLITDAEINGAREKLKSMRSQLSDSKAKLKSLQTFEEPGKKETLEQDVARYESEIKEAEEAFKARRFLRLEITKEVLADIESYEALPAKVVRKIDELTIREERIKGFRKFLNTATESKEPVVLPILDSQGAIKWVEEPHTSLTAREELSSLLKKVKKGEVKKEIYDILKKQADLRAALQIYKDYMLKSKMESPELFGNVKRKILTRIIEALDNEDYSPGYKALLAYESKAFREEFFEASGLSTSTPQDRIRKQLTLYGGALHDDFAEKIGAVRNTFEKRFSTYAMSTALSGILTVASYAGITSIPQTPEEASQMTVEQTVGFFEGAISKAFFYVDKQNGFLQASKELAKTPPKEKEAWLTRFVLENGLDTTDPEVLKDLNRIIEGSKSILAVEMRLEEQRQEEERERSELLRTLLGELHKEVR